MYVCMYIELELELDLELGSDETGPMLEVSVLSVHYFGAFRLPVHPLTPEQVQETNLCC